MIAIMYQLKTSGLRSNQLIRSGMLVFITVFIKCLFNGYEYITTSLVMMTVPFVMVFGIRQGCVGF